MAKKFCNLLGKRFGKLTVTGGGYIIGKQRFWEVVCDCGTKKTVLAVNLLNGRYCGCGCLKRKNLLGLRFGRGVVVSFVGRRIRGKTSPRSSPVWHLRCDCGNEYDSHAEYLTSNQVSSCGCYQKEFHNIPSGLVSNGTEEACFSRFFINLKRGALDRRIIFSLTKDELWNLFVTQNRVCALSGLPLSFKDKTASLDRIDNRLPYSMDNVHFVYRTINFMKNTLSLTDFLLYCKKVAFYKP